MVDISSILKRVYLRPIEESKQFVLTKEAEAEFQARRI